MQKFRIEMVLPDDIDPSEVLTRFQELAVELCAEFAPEGHDGEQVEPDSVAVENEVSVEVLPWKPEQDAFHTKDIFPDL